MHLDFMLERFRDFADRDAVVWRDQPYSYDWVADRVAHWLDAAKASGLSQGAVVSVEADFSPDSIALFLALTQHACVVVPLTASVAAKRDEYLRVGQVEYSITLGDDSTEGPAARSAFEATGTTADHAHYAALRQQGLPGLVLFSSGTTGDSKAAVHNLAAVLTKYTTRRPAKRMISFLLFDHIGGVNTMLHSLSNGGCLVTVAERTPRAVLQAVAQHAVEVIPTSPTFINLILLSRAEEGLDLSSLKVVTYGTESMPESTLLRFNERFPGIKLHQTYGLSEVGILRSKSKDSRSLWMKIGGEGFETRVVDDMLEIKAKSAMLGYLNAPSPFTEDGWFQTGDEVLVDGDYVQILGRRSELINVGGQKVYPAEVESVIKKVDNVADAVVYGEASAILGQMVCATVQPQEPEDKRRLKKRIKTVCRQQLQPYMVPAKIVIDTASQAGARFKKDRNPQRLVQREPTKKEPT